MYMSVIGPCIMCGNLFSFSATRVPSLMVNGTREPVCSDCVPKVNEIRREHGLDDIVPLPGAYEADEDI